MGAAGERVAVVAAEPGDLAGRRFLRTDAVGQHGGGGRALDQPAVEADQLDLLGGRVLRKPGRLF